MITNLIMAFHNIDMVRKRRRLQSNHSWNRYYIMKVKETLILRIKKKKEHFYNQRTKKGREIE